VPEIGLQKSQIRHKKCYDRKTKVRTLEKGDEVYVLLPTYSNKLLLQWNSPLEILERVRGDDSDSWENKNISCKHAKEILD